MANRLGSYLVEYRYRVDPLRHDELRPLLGRVGEYAEDLGLASFQVWVGDADRWWVTELHGYDSWAHFQRLAQKDPPADVQAVYAQLGRLIEGGLAAIEERAWTPWNLEDSDG
jgi:hypothetical protein